MEARVRREGGTRRAPRLRRLGIRRCGQAARVCGSGGRGPMRANMGRVSGRGDGFRAVFVSRDHVRTKRIAYHQPLGGPDGAQGFGLAKHAGAQFLAMLLNELHQPDPLGLEVEVALKGISFGVPKTVGVKDVGESLGGVLDLTLGEVVGG